MKRHKVKLGVALLCGAVLCAVPSAQAATIVEDDFEGVTPPAAPSATTWTSSNATTTRDSTTFGAETTYVSFTGSVWSKNLADLPDVTTLSFKFVDQTPIGGSTAAGEALQVGWAISGGDLNGDGQVVKFLLNQGTIRGASNNTLSPTTVSYAMETPHVLQLIYNASDTTTLTDYFESMDLAPNTAHLWLNGDFVASITTNATQAARTPGRFGFRLFNGNSHVDVKIDDVSLTGGAVVPEPASLGLLGLGAVALLRRRRQAA